MTTANLKVQGMSCNHCVNSVEGAVQKLGAAGKVNLSAGSVAVEYDESKVTLDTIKAAIEDQGYDVVG
ncbi:copper chaperone CopZ [Paenibacillus gorillae]|uniref:copper chaperone CopZ n=1 Tax=Paenibacillus gorillae TaxID=1243662 RepID=UPI0004B149C1|nr:copper chaperone CopZ [Paenibacillus gorillae]